MYCPKCGLAIVDQARFCSRCGFQLDGLAAMLSNNGLSSPGNNVKINDKPLLQRPSIRRGAKMIFASIVASPVFLALSIGVDTPAPLLVPLTLFLGGIFWILYFALFGESHSDTNESTGFRQLRQARNNKKIKGVEAIPLESKEARGFDTGEAFEIPASSITDHTTELLRKK